MEEFLCDCESCLSFNFGECTRQEEAAQIHNSVEKHSWLQDDDSGEETLEVFEFIEIPSYVALISDDSSEPVSFVKVETKGICEETMADTYGHTLNSGENYFQGKLLQRVRSRKWNIKQFHLINKDVFVIPVEVFEAFIGFDDELMIDSNEFLHLIEQSRIW